MDCRDQKGEWLKGDDLISWYKERFGDKTILAFSAGKDSVTAALALRDKIEVIPVYRVMFPGLEFVEKTLYYYERALFDGRPIHRVAHPYGWNAIVNQCDMEPAAAARIGRLNLQYISSDGAHALDRAAAKADLPIALGVRAADSARRYLTLKSNGPYSAKARLWYPIWPMKRAEQISLIRKSGVRLSIDYRVWGRSFDGFEWKYLQALKKHFPSDFAKMIEVFPLLEADFVRHERSYH